jgi:hypothetical protein
MDCKHIHLIKVVNIEDGGEKSKIYMCQECKELFQIGPVPPITVTYGEPPK